MAVSARNSEAGGLDGDRGVAIGRVILAAGILALLAGVGFFLERQARERLGREVAELRLQLSDLKTLHQGLAERLDQAPQSVPESLPTGIDLAELTRLRSEVARLRDQLMQLERTGEAPSNQLAAARGETAPFIYPDSTRRKDYVFSGYTAPQSALQSLLWAITQSDVNAYRASLSPAMAQQFSEQYKDMPEGVMPGGFKNGMMYKASGFRVLEETPISDDETRLKVFLEGRQNIVLKLVFKKIDGEWKHARNE